MTKYITISGDKWDGIAKKVLGSELLTDKLIRSNLKYSHIFIFKSGIELTIPIIEEEAPLQLPPWKRGLV